MCLRLADHYEEEIVALEILVVGKLAVHRRC